MPSFLDRHIVRRPFGGGDAALVVNLGGGDVPVAEQLLDLADIDAGTQEEGRRRGPERVWRVRAGGRLISATVLALGVARQPFEVRHDQAVHRRGVEGGVGEFLAAGVLPGPKERPFFNPGLGDVVGDRLGGRKMDADGAAAGAFLVNPDGGAVGIVVDVLDAEAAAGGDPGPGIEVEFQNRPVAGLEDGIAGRQRPGFLAGIGSRNSAAAACKYLKNELSDAIRRLSVFGAAPAAIRGFHNHPSRSEGAGGILQDSSVRRRGRAESQPSSRRQEGQRQDA